LGAIQPILKVIELHAPQIAPRFESMTATLPGQCVSILKVVIDPTLGEQNRIDPDWAKRQHINFADNLDWESDNDIRAGFWNVFQRKQFRNSLAGEVNSGDFKRSERMLRKADARPAKRNAGLIKDSRRKLAVQQQRKILASGAREDRGS